MQVQALPTEQASQVLTRWKAQRFDAGTRLTKLALRIATSPSDRWLRKAADWNPELSTRYRTNRAIGRPRKRWEDDINEFLKQEFEDTTDPIESNNQTNKTWINIAKDRSLHNDREKNEMTVTKDAAPPQFRTAGINN